jgi:hypothetical protein
VREWQGWNATRSSQALEARLAEALKPLNELRQERQAAAVTQRVTSEASQMYQKASSWHGFKAHEAEIAKVFDANPSFDLKDAYLDVLHRVILPTLPAQAQAKVVADLQSKAAAQSLNPAGSARPSMPEFKGDTTDRMKAALEHFSGKR